MSRFYQVSLVALGLLAVVGVAHAGGGNGVGSGGLNGFPAVSSGSGVDLVDGGNVGGCLFGGGQIYCPIGKFDVLDAGVGLINGTLRVTGTILANGGTSAITLVTGTDRVSWVSSGVWVRANAGVETNSSFNPATGYMISGVVTDSATAPTISNGCTGESVTWTNGTAEFQFDVGTSCTGVSTTTITFPAAAHVWGCDCDHVTSPATRYEATTSWPNTTSQVLTNFVRTTGVAGDYADGDDILCRCRGG